MAIEPKTPRKRAAKKVVVGAVTEASDLPVKKSVSKKSAPTIPVPIFQAAEATNAKPVRAPRLKVQVPASEPVAKKSTSRKKVPVAAADGDGVDLRNKKVSEPNQRLDPKMMRRPRLRPIDVDVDALLPME
jgi:ribonuclease E